MPDIQDSQMKQAHIPAKAFLTLEVLGASQTRTHQGNLVASPNLPMPCQDDAADLYQEAVEPFLQQLHAHLLCTFGHGAFEATEPPSAGDGPSASEEPLVEPFLQQLHALVRSLG